MKRSNLSKTLMVILTLSVAPALCHAKTIVHTNFGSKRTFAALGWRPAGNWNIFKYKVAKNNPGWVARYPANPPANGTLTYKFKAVKNPKKLLLSVDVGWGWGGANMGSDSVGFQLLDSQGNGYVFVVCRTIAGWAVQWGKVANFVSPATLNWAPKPIDATIPSILDGGGMEHLEVTRTADGHWVFSSKDWNKGAGGKFAFTDTTTTSFSRIVLLGTTNVDDQDYNNVVLKVVK